MGPGRASQGGVWCLQGPDTRMTHSSFSQEEVTVQQEEQKLVMMKMRVRMKEEDRRG